MKRFDFSLEKQIKIHRISLFYKREAEKCLNAKAYLSGCIFIGAAMEGLLITTINCCYYLILETKSAPRKKGEVKELELWKFHELLSVAKELMWLPSSLSPEEEWDIARAQIGDYVEVIRQIRNLIHPVRYVDDIGKKKITKKYLAACFNILEAAADQLTMVVKLSLKAMRVEQRKRRDGRNNKR